jgi:3-oxoacyl-[acyl-carrier-protein] synthase-3
MVFAGITGTGVCVPEKIVTNYDLEKTIETSDEWITTRTGIKQRCIADSTTAVSDLSTEAARRAIEDAGIDPVDIDLIIIATVTPDMLFPSTACIVQKNIGAVNAAGFDIEAGCTGFIYALTVANSFIQSGVYKNVLVIGAEVLSKIIDWNDRSTCVLFGDGAGAVVLSAMDQPGLLSNYIKSDGRGGDLLYVPAGGSKLPTSAETVEQKLHYVRMNGNEVFKFAVRIIGEAVETALKKAGLGLSDIDFLIPHQANQRIVDAAVKRLMISRDKVYVNLDRYGNMSSASIPVALDEAKAKGLIKTGDTVVLVGFGAGLTWGANVLRWIK